jgi:hypothetical protein
VVSTCGISDWFSSIYNSPQLIIQSFRMYACAEDYDRTAQASLSLSLLGLACLHRVQIWHRPSHFLGTERLKPVTWVNAVVSSSIACQATSGGLLITDRGAWSSKRSPIQALEEQHPPYRCQGFDTRGCTHRTLSFRIA